MRTALLHFPQCIFQVGFPPLCFAADMLETRGTSSECGWLCTKLPITRQDFQNVLQTTNSISGGSEFEFHALKIILPAAVEEFGHICFFHIFYYFEHC